MSHRPHVLSAIHEWDVFTFRRIVTRCVRSPLIRVARQISHTGNGYLYPLMPLALLLAGAREPLTFLKLALLAFGAERIIYFFAKHAFKRKRPANILPNYRSVIIASDEFSFPSGHTSAAFLAVTLLVIFYGPAFAIGYVWSVMMAASRVILGVHFPSDVLVGSVMGSSLALIASALYL